MSRLLSKIITLLEEKGYDVNNLEQEQKQYIIDIIESYIQLLEEENL